MSLFGEIQENSIILLYGQSLDGKKEIICKYVEDSIKKNKPVVFVTTDHSAEAVKIDLVKNRVFYAKNIKFVDCQSSQSNESLSDSEDVKRVPGPLALNEMSIAISDIEREYLRQNPKHSVIFDSLSTLLLYSNPQAIARFMQVMIGKIKNVGGSGVFTIEKNMHDEKVVATILHIMDGLIEFKKEDGRNSIKTSGFGSGQWQFLD